MIDCENDVFEYVSSRVREKFDPVYITGEYVKTPSSFPCISLVEVDNAVYRNSQTTSGKENHAAITYELNIYSNKSKGRKTECKEIAAFIDELLSELNFTRMLLEPVPNQDEPTIYRMLGRYRAVVSKNKTIFRR